MELDIYMYEPNYCNYLMTLKQLRLRLWSCRCVCVSKIIVPMGQCWGMVTKAEGYPETSHCCQEFGELCVAQSHISVTLPEELFPLVLSLYPSSCLSQAIATFGFACLFVQCVAQWHRDFPLCRPLDLLSCLVYWTNNGRIWLHHKRLDFLNTVRRRRV